MPRKTFVRGLVLVALAAGSAQPIAPAQAVEGMAVEGMANAELMLPVPTVTIYPGDTIKDSMLRMQAYPATYRARTAVIDASAAIAGRVARRMLLPGEPVPVNAVDDPRLVSRGAPTQMIFEENGLVITAVGAPLQNGGLGETIRVRNTDTNRIILGTVMADGRIRIGAQ
ncbi:MULTISPECIES: flagellar basal body P-ring formation chaperone FlgA [Methylobacteriaceae]|uniref:flagellar basal body P-ring formation chaperone FlgA n=1 Tax=Methylobacteriaceae TaxID=119045 RepID=UPI00074FA779|nr:MULTISPECIES: flagellar basal body P-ring formation chaperone FlgA [Methylobacteriaceae]AMB43682.1 FlgA, flagellar basal-body P-ring formation protein [Methylobacterium sp. AMS5]TFZ56979.1 flagellar basal body P-ring formation protein FlgA [Methylorubrum sp. Q1]